MCKKTIAIFIFMTGLVFDAVAEPKSIKVNVTGEVYRECFISTENITIDIGRVRVSDWVPGYANLRDFKGRKFIDYTLTDCDPGTTIKITAKAQRPNEDHDSRWYIKNENDSSPNLTAGIAIQYPGATGIEILWTNEQHARTYTTTANGNQTIRFAADLRRVDVTQDSVGTFSGAATIYFTFE